MNISQELINELESHYKWHCLKVGNYQVSYGVEVDSNMRCMPHLDYYAENGKSYLKVETNVYELAHKCKEKAREYGYSITTGNRVDGTNRYKDCK